MGLSLKKRISFDFYSCKGKRLKTPMDPYSIIDQGFLYLLPLTVILLIILMYYCLVISVRGFYKINLDFYYLTGIYLPWEVRIIFQVIVGFSLVYSISLTVFGFSNQLRGYRVHLHIIHKILIVSILMYVAATFIFLRELFYPYGWSLILTSLQVYGIYLQITVVVIITFITCCFAEKIVNTESILTKGLKIGLITTIFIALFLSPNYIESPCVFDEKEDIPPKPKLIAHRGVSMYAPENTIAAFYLALNDSNVVGIEADVRLTSDNVPIIFHDKTLIHTSNIKDVFPTRVHAEVSDFTIDELETLDVGSWFLKVDPYNTVGALSASQRESYKGQKIVRLSKLLDIVKDSNCSIIFDFKYDISEPHILELIKKSGIEYEKIWWYQLIREPGVDNYHASSWYHSESQIAYEYNFTILTGSISDEPAVFSKHNVYLADRRPTWIHWKDIKDYHYHNILVDIWTVDNYWHFSYWWCANADYIMTDDTIGFGKMTEPSLFLKKRIFLWMWVLSNLTCGVAVISVFSFHFYRKTKNSETFVI